MLRNCDVVRWPVLLVAMGMFGALSCKVDVETPNWDALPSDPGVVQDLGDPVDPGETTDDGERPDTVVPQDPGTSEDPGISQDPGTVGDPGTAEDTAADIPFEPCSLTFNPSCTPTACDDGNPETANDQCMGGVDADSVPFCECVGSAISIDPCEPLDVDQCVNINCDDGDARTEGDTCGWGLDDDGIGACVCIGTPVLGSACARDLNPTCESVACMLGGLIPGNCGKGGVLEGCGCISADPCTRVFNPNCNPEQCVTEKGVLGHCGNTGTITCSCEESTIDPCGSKVNPVCSGQICLRGGKLGLGQCRPTLDGCDCDAVDTQAPCGSFGNPQCKPTKCDLAKGISGVCRETSIGMCICDKER